ncbi:excinuclease ABC subunit UvrA [Tepidimonas taiwanensis]|uniref:UvrABC system protein A n=1 Tax=Tepidimonas taiwanensis TaxID=307486 RepID=A0A554XA79_9BURK|nr:excinuclease ABC subunit UvrA [Tepidimonas taiwanensis]MCX7694035.1 excinuclease ABC subunit UvrA [Tepidimonas taiwanensis]MDM7462679.1 excinuclease ABC subunit UvrA [Tepidimonas taiwanensis]TSE32723.1 UvrABC system protein A [Tepidimonas taiwanensis]UBQ05459.1 excinuclease ABC subunit UvrA [Tepidimonas taiwanensis]
MATPNPAPERCIRIRGARTHNLRNIDLDIPKDSLVVITGLSGSGKSSLAFDTLYAEGQRRYVESLSAYARQFLERMDKPDVDLIEGLSPAIAIEQKATSHNPRSTVGTVTEIHDYLRLLFARAGVPHCPQHDRPLQAQTVSQMVDALLALPADTRLMVLAPQPAAADPAAALRDLQAQGYVRFRIGGSVADADEAAALLQPGAPWEVVIDRLKVRPDARQRLAESLEAALRLADGRVQVLQMDDGALHAFTTRYACPVCDHTQPPPEPRLFSFNAPQGACPRCDGLGHVEQFDAARVVAFPELSLAGGAIKGWDRRNAHYYALIESLAAHYGFDPETPWQDLPERVRHVLLHGSGTEAIAFQYGADGGRRVTKHHPFEGILPNFERRWRDTDSPAVREELGRYRSTHVCPACHGSRLRPEAMHVFIGEGAQRRTLHDIAQMTLAEALAYFDALRLHGARAEIAERIVREIRARLRFLNDVGLPYLTLARSADTLSGGEAQRIRLASQIGSGLSGVMYVLDEPSIGLHQRDNDRLIATLQRLRDLGNTVIVVEHDEDMMRAADHLIDLGPGAGVHGGRVVAQGHWTAVAAEPASLTGQFLSGQRCIPVPRQRTPWRSADATGAAANADAPPRRGGWPARRAAADPTHATRTDGPARAGAAALRLVGARGRNLRHVTVDFPVGLFTCVTGVSGSGKSTLVNDTLLRAVARHLYRSHDEPEPYDAIEGLEHFDKVIAVDQSPIGRTPRSNPATYTGLFTTIRELMAETPAARERGYGPGRFSFNVPGGRCEACQGDGVVKVEMHFLPDVYVPCDVCRGARYNRETLEVRYKGKHIAEILDLTVEQAHAFFSAVPALQRKLQTLLDVGLGYVRLGQSATTLSGGEAQRVKLAQELAKRDTGRTLYILDEPTTGLHFGDIELLLRVLHQLRDAGNTIVVIEHNLDVIKTADWVIDMGPEGGAGGGTVVACGTPEDIATHPDSHTGRYLARVLAPR